MECRIRRGSWSRPGRPRPSQFSDWPSQDFRTSQDFPQTGLPRLAFWPSQGPIPRSALVRYEIHFSNHSRLGKNVACDLSKFILRTRERIYKIKLYNRLVPRNLHVSKGHVLETNTYRHVGDVQVPTDTDRYRQIPISGW